MGLCYLSSKWKVGDQEILGMDAHRKAVPTFGSNQAVGTRDFLEAMQFSRQQERSLELKQRAAG